MHRFRFAVQASQAASGPAWRELARKAEGLGYSTLFVPDHLDRQFGPLVALTVAAEATTTLKVGSLVFGNDYRHPVVLAKELATLDLLSDGRLEVGLGAGWMSSDYDQAGIPRDRPGIRVDRMAESLEVMRSMWAEGRATFRGQHYQVADAVGFPVPVQRPGPKIIVGGGSRRVLTLAGRRADIVGINPSLAAGVVGPEVLAGSTAAHYRERVGWVEEGAGDRFPSLELQCLIFVVQVVDNPTEALAGLASMFSFPEEQVAEMPMVLVGSVAQIAETLCRRRDELGISYVVVHGGDLEAFAPVVARLAGT